MIVFYCILVYIESFSAANAFSVEGKILGGKDVPIEEYPYQISLRYMDNHICGAGILDQTYAVTAAHCTEGFETNFLSVQYGITSLDDDGHTIQVKKVYQHPKFKMVNRDYDLAILKLAENIEFSERALPINILKTVVSLDGQMGIVTGWGVSNEDGGELTNKLQAVEIPILDQNFCKEEYKSLAPISSRMFCAGFSKGGKDSCQGDSGSPFAVNGELVGVVSWGWGCGEASYPGVYANISAMRLFINEVVETEIY